MPNTLFDKIIEQEQTKKKTEKQQKIIETAITLFAEKGYSNTSTAEIAKAAGVSEGIIFKHYGTKDKLLLSVMVPFIKDFSPTMIEEVLKATIVDNTTTLEQFFKALLVNRVKFILDNKEIFQIFVKEVIYKEELKKEILPYLFDHIPKRLESVIEAFKSRGEIMDLPNKEILNTVFTVLGGFFITRFVLIDNYMVSSDEIDHIVRFVMYGLSNQNGKE